MFKRLRKKIQFSGHPPSARTACDCSLTGIHNTCLRNSKQKADEQVWLWWARFTHLVSYIVLYSARFVKVWTPDTKGTGAKHISNPDVAPF